MILALVQFQRAQDRKNRKKEVKKTEGLQRIRWDRTSTMNWQHQNMVKGRWERERRDRNRQTDNENGYSWGINKGESVSASPKICIGKLKFDCSKKMQFSTAQSFSVVGELGKISIHWSN